MCTFMYKIAFKGIKQTFSCLIFKLIRRFSLLHPPKRLAHLVKMMPSLKGGCVTFERTNNILFH